MATRIYLPSSGAAPVTPSTWNFPNQINPLEFAGVLARLNSAQTTRLQATGTTSPTLRAMFRWVIGPLAAQSIAGTINLVMQCFESNALANATLAVAVKIIKPDLTDRAVLLAAVGSDSAASPQEMSLTPLANKRAWNLTEVRPIPLTTQSAVAGDYLVIEVGFRSATTTTRNISIRYGDTTAGELADADSGASDYAPWIDFSQTLTWPEAHSGSAIISGNGSQVGSGQKGGKGLALTSAAGALVAIGMAGMLAIASISGGGSQVATGKKATVGSAILSGNGSLTATGEKFEGEQHSGVAVVSGNGSLVSEGKKNGQSFASVSANGQLTSSGTKSAGATVQISTNGLPQGEGSKQGSGDSSISGTGSLHAEGFQPESYSGTGIISGNGFVSSTGKKNAEGTMSIHIEPEEAPILLISDGSLGKKLSSYFILKL